MYRNQNLTVWSKYDILYYKDEVLRINMNKYDYNGWTITPIFDAITQQRVKVEIYNKDFGCLVISKLTDMVIVRRTTTTVGRGGSKDEVWEEYRYDEAASLIKLSGEAQRIVDFLNHVIEINTENVQSKMAEITLLNMTFGLHKSEVD